MLTDLAHYIFVKIIHIDAHFQSEHNASILTYEIGISDYKGMDSGWMNSG